LIRRIRKGFVEELSGETHGGFQRALSEAVYTGGGQGWESDHLEPFSFWDDPSSQLNSPHKRQVIGSHQRRHRRSGQRGTEVDVEDVQNAPAALLQGDATISGVRSRIIPLAQHTAEPLMDALGGQAAPPRDSSPQT
jgi:hypothetical protein